MKHMKNDFLKRNGIDISVDEKEKWSAAVEKIKKFRPEFELEFRKKAIKPTLDGFKNDLFEIDLLENVFREQLKEGYIELPESIGNTINPFTERTYELISNVKKFGCGFFSVTIQSFEMTLNDSRKIDRNRLEKLEFFIGYDVERKHYFFSRTEDGFKRQYQPVREVLEQNKIQTTIDLFETFLRKFFGENFNMISQFGYTIEDIKNTYTVFTEFKFVHDLYFKILLYTNVITDSIYSSLQRQYSIISFYIETYFKDIAELDNYDKNERVTDVLIELAKHRGVNDTFYSNQIPVIAAELKKMSNRALFCDYIEKNVYRNFYEEYLYHQKSHHHFETKEYLDVEMYLEYLSTIDSNSDNKYYIKEIDRKKKVTLNDLYKRINEKKTDG